MKPELPEHLKELVKKIEEKQIKFSIEEISCDEIFEKFNTEW